MNSQNLKNFYKKRIEELEQQISSRQQNIKRQEVQRQDLNQQVRGLREELM